MILASDILSGQVGGEITAECDPPDTDTAF